MSETTTQSPVAASEPSPASEEKVTQRHKTYQHPTEYVVMPAAQKDSQQTTFSATKAFLDTPSWLKVVCGIALALMANQLRLAPSGILHKLYLSDISFLVAAGLALCFLFRKKHRLIHLPYLCLVPVIFASFSNLMNGTGMQGLAEACQMAATFVGGIVLFAFMLRHMPLTTLLGVTGGLLLNLIAATVQDVLYGAFITIAPKDIMELPYGIGQSVTGLFRSKIAFSCYMAAVLSWAIPLWLSAPFKGRKQRMLRVTACFVLAFWGIYLIPHAMFAILAAAIVITTAFTINRTRGIIVAFGVALAILSVICVPDSLHFESWNATISPLKGYNFVPDASVLFNTPKPIHAESPSPQAHELKTCHYDFIAALRLAATHAWFGVGSGNYQKEIGAAYALDEDREFGQLASTRINDIETDSQAGWGIIAATLGFPALFCFAYFFLSALGKNLKRIHDDFEDGFFMHIGGAAAITVFFLALFLCDPLIRGLCWFFALALASAETGPVLRVSSVYRNWNTFTRPRLLQFFIIAMLFLACVPSGPAVSRLMVSPDTEKPAPASKHKPVVKPAEKPTEAAEKPAEATEAKPAEATEAKPAAKPAATESPLPPEAIVAEDSDELFIVFNADKATDITMPMRKADDDSGTYEKGLLVIPDQTGVPPAGKNPALEYGGAVFHFVVSRETTAYVWCSVMWDGSCGNTLDVRLDNEEMTYTVGNDGTYNAWHWQKSPKSCKLTPGRHRLEVLNREDGIKLAQVLLLNDKDYIPDGVEGE